MQHLLKKKTIISNFRTVVCVPPPPPLILISNNAAWSTQDSFYQVSMHQLSTCFLFLYSITDKCHVRLREGVLIKTWHVCMPSGRSDGRKTINLSYHLDLVCCWSENSASRGYTFICTDVIIPMCTAFKRYPSNYDVTAVHVQNDGSTSRCLRKWEQPPS